MQLELLPCALSDLFASATVSGWLTIADRYGILAALLKEKLTEEEVAVIDRILHAVRRGRVKVCTDLSAG